MILNGNKNQTHQHILFDFVFPDLKMFVIFTFLCMATIVKDCSSLNLNFVTNNVIDIFGVTDNELGNNTIVKDDDPPPHKEVAR